jgi:mortality factor 4-like protein 1
MILYLLKPLRLSTVKIKIKSLREPKLVLPTIVSGLTCYFDRSLGANLLYRFERPQYASVRKQYITGSHVIVGQEKEMSQVYGAEHFLRMLGGSESLSVWGID